MRIHKDGDMWCLTDGANLQVGTAMFGKTPDEAVRKFKVIYPDYKRESVRLIEANLGSLKGVVTSFGVEETSIFEAVE